VRASFHAVLFLAGAICLALLVNRIGLQALWDDAQRLGWGAAIIVAIEGLEHLLHTAAWRGCFSRCRRPSWTRLLGAYFAGYAVSFATPTATVGGELARGGLLPRHVPTVDVIASITLDRLTYAVADSIIGLTGVAVILGAAPLSEGARAGLAAAAALFAAAIATFFWLQRKGRLAGLFANNGVLRRMIGPRLAERFAEGGAAVDRRLVAFHADEPGAFGVSVCLHMAGTAVSALQIAIFLYWMEVSFQVQTVLMVFVVATAIDLFSFFIPFRLGAHEAARMLAMSVAGLDPTLGLLLALVIRVEHVAWATLGLLIYLGVVMRRAVPRIS
jgi:Lysylphosphatidylglycerol synthase TM region